MVKQRKDAVTEIKLKVEKQLVHAHFEAKAAWDAGATEAEMKRHSAGYPSRPMALGLLHRLPRGADARPEVALRMLGTALDKAADARTKLARLLAAMGSATRSPFLTSPARRRPRPLLGWT